MAVRIHLFPSRTQKLSSPVSTILGWRRPGKIERRRHILLYSSIAQSVERMTVNHDVTGSSPVGGAMSEQSSLCSDFFLSLKEIRPATSHPNRVNSILNIAVPLCWTGFFMKECSAGILVLHVLPKENEESHCKKSPPADSGAGGVFCTIAFS